MHLSQLSTGKYKKHYITFPLPKCTLQRFPKHGDTISHELVDLDVELVLSRKGLLTLLMVSSKLLGRPGPPLNLSQSRGG